MNVEFLSEYFMPVVVGICLCIGYIIKMWTPADNRIIPTVCGILGIFLAIWFNGWTVTPQIVLSGMFSGLASTGLHELFKQLIDKGE
jgi:hypothetical protein